MVTYLYPILFLLFSIYSFAHTDPNLIYSHDPTFLQFQYKMWGIGLQNRALSTAIYVAIITALFMIYALIIKQIRAKKISHQQAIFLTATCIGILIFANPALSHDIFNYIFNAKMVVEYHANPHIQTALEFVSDPWTRFMHNIHTPAPYGYGWTALSLAPYLLGFGNFKLTLLLFKVFILIFFFITVTFQSKIQSLLQLRDKSQKLLLFALNPLVLIESFANGHNDLVMMGLAIIAIFFFLRFAIAKRWGYLIVALLVFSLSVSIKLATITLVVSLFVIALQSKAKSKLSIGTICAFLIFLPLFTVRAQQFLPWYLIWPLSFIPFITEKKVVFLLVTFSYASLLRYVPTIYLPMFDRPISETSLRAIEVAITFLIPALALAIFSMTNKVYVGKK